MTVKELIERLGELDPNLPVLVSKDEEGNGFSPLTDVELGSYLKDGHRCGIYELTEELAAKGYSEEDVQPDGKCVVIWP